MNMNMSPISELHSSPRQIRADGLEDQGDDVTEPRPRDDLEQAQEVAPDEATLAEKEGLPEYYYNPDGKTWRWIDGEYCCISSGEDDEDWEEYDPVASAQLLMRTLAQFSRHHYRMSPEQHAERQRRWAAKHAERAREVRARARSDQAWRTRPEPTPAPRPRTVRTRRSSATTHATADPTPPPPAPAPAAISAASDPGPTAPLPHAVSALARPPAPSDRRVPALHEGAADHEVSSSLAPRPDAAGCSSSPSRRSPRPKPTSPLDPRLLPVAHAFADLLLADLLKYPPSPDYS